MKQSAAPESTEQKTLTLARVQDLLQAKIICCEDLSIPVTRVGAADLLSDVLALSTPGMLLITALTSLQVVRTAHVADLSAVLFVRGKLPGEDTQALARSFSLPLLATTLSMFEAAGLLYRELADK